MRFKFLTGDVNWLQYGGSWVSQRLNNGEFDYWIVIRLINWEDACGANAPKETYNVELLSVSPSEAGEENLASAFSCCGLDGPEQASLRENPLVQVECLVSYGVYANLWQANGNNAHKLLKEARHQAICAAGLYGFYMDRTQNRIGSTGWEFQRGDLQSAMTRI
jgi:hypothetical protein